MNQTQTMLMRFNLFFFLVLFLGIYYRVHNVDVGSHFLLNADLGRDVLVASKELSTSSFLSIKPLAGFSDLLQNTPVYYWYISLLYHLAGGAEGLLILHALISGMLIINAYFFSHYYFKNVWSKLLLLSLFSLSPDLITFSRNLSQYTVSLLFFSLTLFRF